MDSDYWPIESRPVQNPQTSGTRYFSCGNQAVPVTKKQREKCEAARDGKFWVWDGLELVFGLGERCSSRVFPRAWGQSGWLRFVTSGVWELSQ